MSKKKKKKRIDKVNPTFKAIADTLLKRLVLRWGLCFLGIVGYVLPLIAFFASFENEALIVGSFTLSTDAIMAIGGVMMLVSTVVIVVTRSPTLQYGGVSRSSEDDSQDPEGKRSTYESTTTDAPDPGTA